MGVPSLASAAFQLCHVVGHAVTIPGIWTSRCRSRLSRFGSALPCHACHTPCHACHTSCHAGSYQVTLGHAVKLHVTSVPSCHARSCLSHVMSRRLDTRERDSENSNDTENTLGLSLRHSRRLAIAYQEEELSTVVAWQLLNQKRTVYGRRWAIACQ